MPDGLDYNPDGSVVMDVPEATCVHYDNTEVLGRALPATETLADEIKYYIQVMELDGMDNPNIGVLRVTTDINDTIVRLTEMLNGHYNTSDMYFQDNIAILVEDVETDGPRNVMIEYEEEGYVDDPDGHWIREIRLSMTWLF